MANPAGSDAWTGAQKDAYAKQYGGVWNGSQYSATGTAPVTPAAAVKPAPIATTPAAAVKPAPIAAVPTNPAGGTTVKSVTAASPTSIVPTTLGSTATTSQAAGGPTIQTAFRDQLVSLLGTDPNSIKLTDSDLAPQARAYADQQQRATEGLQRSLAEQGFAGGALHTGAYDSERNNALTQQGENQGQFNANLLSNAKTQRLNTLMGALGLGQQSITGGDATKLQSGLGTADINQRANATSGQIGLGLLQALLGDKQASNSLGLNAAEFGAGLNSQSVLKMLGLG